MNAQLVELRSLSQALRGSQYYQIVAAQFGVQVETHSSENNAICQLPKQKLVKFAKIDPRPYTLSLFPFTFSIFFLLILPSYFSSYLQVLELEAVITSRSKDSEEDVLTQQKHLHALHHEVEVEIPSLMKDLSTQSDKARKDAIGEREKGKQSAASHDLTAAKQHRSAAESLEATASQIEQQV